MKPDFESPCGKVKLYCADCMDVLPTLGKVDLCLTDPPYVMTANGGGIGKRRKYLADILGNLDAGFNFSLLSQFENWFCFCSKEQLPKMLSFAETKHRWMLIVWNKPNPTPLCENTYLPDCEYIVHAFGKNRVFGEYKDKSRVIIHNVEKNDFNHPTVKPIRVIQKLVVLGSEQGETIADPFMGSGTTGVAALKCGRKFIGIEKEPKYFEIAKRRICQELDQFKLNL